MAYRPDNHIIGDVAVNRICSDLLPESWIANDVAKDYGLDLLVEVVANNQTTGHLFFIQSKGTHNSAINNIIKYSLEVDRLKDYASMPNPILLVYYSIPDNMFWGKWMNCAYECLSSEEKEQHSITITFGPENVIDRNYLTSIGTQISLAYSRMVYLQKLSEFEDEILYHQQIVKLLLRSYKDTLSVDNRLAWNRLTLCYDCSSSDMQVSITYGDKCVKVSHVIFPEPFLWYPQVSIYDCNREIRLLMLVVAFLLVKQDNKVTEFWSLDLLQDILKLVSVECMMDWVSRCDREDAERITQLLETGLTCRELNIVKILLMVLFLKVDCFADLYMTYTLKIAKLMPPSEQDFALIYNCANSIRRSGKYRESVLLYCHAARIQPKYRNIEYWNREIAGVLFLTEHYYFAELFYKKSYEIKNDTGYDVCLLIADCLAHQGKIAEAIEWTLKQSDMYVEIGKAVPGKIHLILRAYDVLNERIVDRNRRYVTNIYWFNAGVAAAEKERYFEAMQNFLCAWVLQIEDVEALKNVMICAINVNASVELAYSILAVSVSALVHCRFPEKAVILCPKTKIHETGHKRSSLSRRFRRL